MYCVIGSSENITIHYLEGMMVWCGSGSGDVMVVMVVVVVIFIFCASCISSATPSSSLIHGVSVSSCGERVRPVLW